MLKDKNKPVAPARARGPRGRKRRPGEAEETADPEPQADTLETCRGLLRSILTHWGPADGAGPESGAPGLACAALSLAVRWVLRSVAEPLPSRAEAAGLLGWLKRHVLPQPGVVAELLGDSAVRSSIFKLYGRFCGAGELAGPTRSLACLFSTVLLQLLAAQGPAPSAWQLAVQSLCLTSLQDEDEATAATAAFLVSLYVKDVWLGAQRPDTLLAHVRMICDATEDTLSGGEEAVVSLCKDIAASVPSA